MNISLDFPCTCDKWKNCKKIKVDRMQKLLKLKTAKI